MPISLSCLPIAHALRTCVRKFLRSCSDPIAEPPPVGGQTGATSGAKRKRSTPSKRMPSTSAAAVRLSMVSRSIAGSLPGPPLPTRPGHMALCSAGDLCWFATLMGSSLLAPQRLGIRIPRPKMLQDDERIGIAETLDRHSLPRGLRRNEQLVLCHLAEPDHARRRDQVLPEFPAPLRQDQAVGGGVPDSHFPLGQHGEFLGRIKTGTVGNPQLAIALSFHLRYGPHGLGIDLVALAEFRIHIRFPIEHAHQVIQIVV